MTRPQLLTPGPSKKMTNTIVFKFILREGTHSLAINLLSSLLIQYPRLLSSKQCLKKKESWREARRVQSSATFLKLAATKPGNHLGVCACLVHFCEAFNFLSRYRRENKFIQRKRTCLVTQSLGTNRLTENSEITPSEEIQQRGWLACQYSQCFKLNALRINCKVLAASSRHLYKKGPSFTLVVSSLGKWIVRCSRQSSNSAVRS